MLRKFFIILTLLFTGILSLFSQADDEVEVFLVTCGPGTEVYSIYGHSALRIIDPSEETDLAYNWGVFDFATPNFAWKFAKGRLEYMLGVYPFERFIQEYFFEQRSVYQQKVNLEPDEIETLFALLKENMKPENIKYKYDFFYDDCSTRIRDILEKTLGDKLSYPPETSGDVPTFRELVKEYQKRYPWLQMGIDLLLGMPSYKKASFRDRMFLPFDLQEGLTDAVVNRNGETVPLLQSTEILLEFDPPEIKTSFLIKPFLVFSLLLIVIIIMSGTIRNVKTNRIIDLIIFSIYSVLAIMMIFFNFFSEHQQLNWNLNIIWLNPFILFCLASLVLNKDWYIWFRIVFSLALIALIAQVLFLNTFNIAFIPLELLLIVRCSMWAGFSWNPLSLTLTEL